MNQWYWFAAFTAIAFGFAKREREQRVTELAAEIQKANLMPTFR